MSRSVDYEVLMAGTCGWVEYGKGHVCVSVFGHCGVQANARDPLEHAPFQRLVVAGILWTAGREVK